MGNTFICYSKCSTCKGAKKWLEENKIEFEDRAIKEDNPTFEELKVWIERSKLPIKRFFNTSGIKYRELELKDKLDTMTDDEKIKLLSTDGMLVKRPLFVSDDLVLVGFKETEWEENLKKAVK